MTMDIIIASPTEKIPYTTLGYELGDRKPSQFLRQLSFTAYVPDNFLRNIWSSG
jgi:hypothetical protein